MSASCSLTEWLMHSLAGNKLLSGCKQVTIDKKTYDVNMQVKNMSFSAHADAKGILGLIK